MDHRRWTVFDRLGVTELSAMKVTATCPDREHGADSETSEFGENSEVLIVESRKIPKVRGQVRDLRGSRRGGRGEMQEKRKND